VLVVWVSISKLLTLSSSLILIGILTKIYKPKIVLIVLGKLTKCVFYD